VRHEVGLGVATPFGAGERWTILWRWEPAIPRRALRLDIPVRIGLPGIVDLEGSWEQYRFATPAPTPIVPLEQRRAATLGFSSWLSGGLEARTGARFERWAAEGDFLTMSLGVGLHGLHDRVALIAQGEEGLAVTGQGSYTSVRSRVAWASPVAPFSMTWSARVGADWTSANAPRGLWPIAGGDLARMIPLRAHPLIVDDVLSTARTGQGIVHGGVAVDRPVATIRPLILSAGLFLDGADVMTSGGGSMRQRRYLDGGAGLRIGVAGAQLVALRIDLARGLLEDRRWGLTVGFQQPWPPLLRGLQ
jgi:hypothetical protein